MLPNESDMTRRRSEVRPPQGPIPSVAGSGWQFAAAFQAFLPSPPRSTLPLIPQVSIYALTTCFQVNMGLLLLRLLSTLRPRKPLSRSSSLHRIKWPNHYSRGPLHTHTQISSLILYLTLLWDPTHILGGIHFLQLSFYAPISSWLHHTPVPYSSAGPSSLSTIFHQDSICPFLNPEGIRNVLVIDIFNISLSASKALTLVCQLLRIGGKGSGMTFAATTTRTVLLRERNIICSPRFRVITSHSDWRCTWGDFPLDRKNTQQPRSGLDL